MTFLSECTGYDDKIMNRSITAYCVNRTRKDIIPPLELKLDSCDSGTKKINLAELQSESIIKDTIMHNDELEILSYKVHDVQKLSEKQDWKLKHSAEAKHSYILGSIGAATLRLLISYYVAVIAIAG